MSSLLTNRKSHHANFFKGKIAEFRYHLEMIVAISDESLMLGRTTLAKHEVLGYTFSSLTNAIQSLKDGGKIFLPSDSLSWGKMKKLRHGGFMYDVRNAITHDGNPVIDAWADGLFFVAANIVRINDKNQIVIIEPPKIDVRQFCLEFSLDFAGLLGETLQQISHEDQFSMSVLSIDEVEAAVRASNVIPPFVKENFLLKRDEIAAIVSNTKISHIADAIKAASDLADYCKVRLG